MKIRCRSIMASESDGNYDISFKKNGTTYYIELLSDGGNYVAKWWDSSDNGLGYNNKGWVAIEGKNYRALNNIGDVNSDNVVDLLSVISDYDRKPGKPIQDRIKREVAKLVDFGSINSGCTKKSVKSNKINKRRAITSAEGLNDMKIIVKSKAYVDITVDDYEQGALNQVNSWDFDVRGEYNTIQELIDRIADESYIFSDNIADYYYMDGRIGTSATVDNDNLVPSEDQIEAWKRGEETLYIADLYLSLEVGGGSHEMTEEEAEAFGLALY